MTCCSSTIIDSLRFAEDYANATDVILGECPYKTFLSISNNDSIDIDTLFNPPVVPTLTRITIADGYRAYLKSAYNDGYMYPQVIQMDGQKLIESGGVLSDNLLVLGPLVLPYTTCGKTGGTDPQIFQPGRNANSNIQILLIGPGLAPNGSYFDIIEIAINAMNNINYDLILKASGNNPNP